MIKGDEFSEGAKAIQESAKAVQETAKLGQQGRLFFRRIEVVGVGRVPQTRPLLYVLNHPNDLRAGRGISQFLTDVKWPGILC